MCQYHTFACLGIKHSYSIMASAQVHRPSQICLTLYPKLSAWYIGDATDMLSIKTESICNIIKQVLGMASYLRLRSLRSQICLARVL